MKNNTSTLRSIASKIPAFPGFYCSRLEMDLESEEYNWKESIHRAGMDWVPKYGRDFETRDAEWRANVAKDYAKGFSARVLKDHGFSCEFVGVRSPKEYNFSSDDCEVWFIFDPVKLAAFALENRDLIEGILSQWFTSRDGFSSYYRPEWKTWAGLFADLSEENQDQDGARNSAYLAASVIMAACLKIEEDGGGDPKAWKCGADRLADDLTEYALERNYASEYIRPLSRRFNALEEYMSDDDAETFKARVHHRRLPVSVK